LDGRVLAYDFKTGTRLWATSIADPKTGETVSAAPIAWNGLVFIGNALGDVKGVKGRMYALSAVSGRIVWESYLVPKQPGDPTRGPQGSMPASAITTWKNAPDVPITGGATWTSYTLDPLTGRLYVPVANGAPDYAKHLREGANLYTNSVAVLDANTGAYIKHFPAAPEGDWHDWDVSNAPSIFVTRCECAPPTKRRSIPSVCFHAQVNAQDGCIPHHRDDRIGTRCAAGSWLAIPSTSSGSLFCHRLSVNTLTSTCEHRHT
jgi:alcohol dehydrogenase (cytochrome c)